MNHALRVLQQARTLGIKLTIGNEGRIDYEADDDPPEWLQVQLVANKPDLLRILRAEGLAGRHVIRVEFVGGKGTPKRAVFVFEEDHDCPVNLDMTLKPQCRT